MNAGEKVVFMQFGKVQDGVLDEGVHAFIRIVTTVKTLSLWAQKTVLILILTLAWG